VVLKFFDNNERRVREAGYGRQYTVKAEVTHPNGTWGIKVKNCFAFNNKNESLALIDDRGCSVDGIMSRFIMSADGLSATAMISSMFKFENGSEIHFQCDVMQCNGKCEDDKDKCSGDPSAYSKTSRGLGQPEDASALLAATTVFVLDPELIPRKFYNFFLKGIVQK
jgi:hypothetical protein